ncbi:response regulator [Acidisoma silvae]|uniref:Response regulator n=1 Tax=Acidisoma silvae TaxID=2802396 RepID=A0A964DYE6_9PROT|nr:response regulator [Acidisoma silvae]MCB8874934.1 response regulator [Acidisoma silvae]
MASILILDDQAAIVMTLAQILSKAGHDVTTGSNGREGMTELSNGLKPSLILTDLNMPEMDGIAFIREARKTPVHKFTPIIVLSGESDGRKRDEARAAGASGWLTKPPQPNQLLYVVKQFLPSK